MDEKPESIEGRALAAESNGEYAKALTIRERLLIVLQKLHGDPSEETDAQKVKMCELICLLATHEHASNTNALVQHATEIHRRQAAELHEYGSEDPLANHQNRKLQLERDAGELVENTSAFSHAKASMQQDGIVTSHLSLQGLLAFGERLLARENTLRSSQENRSLRQVRSNLLMHLATVLYRQGRPRAALPLARAAQAELLALAPPPERATLDVATGYLTLCSVLSASNKHKEALRCALASLQTVFALEHRMAENDPTRSEMSKPIVSTVQTPHPVAAAHCDGQGNPDDDGPTSARGAALPDVLYPADLPSSGLRGNNNNNTTTTSSSFQQCFNDEDIVPGSYLGSLLAACYHNIGAEQEHLSLFELALRTYGIGFRVAKRAHGDAHPLVERIYNNYCTVFQSVNYKHFYPDGRRPGEKSTALADPDRAVRRLNFSFLSTSRHQKALEKEERMMQALLADSEDVLSHVSQSNTQHLVSRSINTTATSSAARAAAVSSSTSASSYLRGRSSSAQRRTSAH